MENNQNNDNYNGQGYYNQQPQDRYDQQYYQPAPNGYPPQNNNQNNGAVPLWVKILIPSVAVICLIVITLVVTGVISPKPSNTPVQANEVVTETTTQAQTETQATQPAPPETSIVYVPIETTTVSIVYVPVPSGYTTGKYQVTGVGSDVLFVRTGPGDGYSKVPYSKLNQDAKNQIYRLRGLKNANGLVNGVVCDVYEVSGDWGRIPSGWIYLGLCTKIG